MNEAPQEPESSPAADASTSPAAEPTSDQPKKKPGRTRLKVLLVILGLAIVAVVWEYLVASPSFNAAKEKVEELVANKDRQAGVGKTTNLVVQKELDRKPSWTEGPDKHPNYTKEIYTWRRGLPLFTYQLHVIYSHYKDPQSGEQTLLLYNADACPRASLSTGLPDSDCLLGKCQHPEKMFLPSGPQELPPRDPSKEVPPEDGPITGGVQPGPAGVGGPLPPPDEPPEGQDPPTPPENN